MFLDVSADIGNIIDIVGRRRLIFAFGFSLSTVGLATSLTIAINAWSRTIHVSALDLQK